MLKDKITKMIGVGIARKFIIWIVVITMLLDALAVVFMEADLRRTLSEDLNDRGQALSHHLAIECRDCHENIGLLPNEGTANLQKIIENMKNKENDIQYVYITNSEGKVIAHTFGGALQNGLLNDSIDTGGSLHPLSIGEKEITEFKAPIPGNISGFFYIGVDRAPIDEKINRITNIVIINIVIMGGLGIIMALIAGNHLARPIRFLVKGAEEIGKGNLGYQIETDSARDEIHTLSTIFNKLSCDLNKSLSEFREFSIAVEEAPDGVQITDMDGYILYSNKAAEELFGFSVSELKGKHVNEMNADSEFAGRVIIPGIKETGRWVGELMATNKERKEFPIWLSTSIVKDNQNKPIAIVRVIRDLTERKEMEKLEKQLMQSDKLATIGLLTAGIAHEISNPLGNVSLYAQLLMKKVSDENDKRKLAIINDEANRAAYIIKELLDFSRPSEPDKSAIDINKEIGKILSILRLQLKDLSVQNPMLKDIRIITDFGDLPLVFADSGQIGQVIMNILTNSVQSITKNGEIMISTVAKEGFVEIRIKDNGCGIPESNINKIFTPFFTTKERGKGTGLGLSISYGIIKRHNGSIEVESEVGKGTTLTIKLPA